MTSFIDGGRGHAGVVVVAHAHAEHGVCHRRHVQNQGGGVEPLAQKESHFVEQGEHEGQVEMAGRILYGVLLLLAFIGLIFGSFIDSFIQAHNMRGKLLT